MWCRDAAIGAGSASLIGAKLSVEQNHVAMVVIGFVQVTSCCEPDVFKVRMGLGADWIAIFVKDRAVGSFSKSDR